ncbi:unnamed protein product [Trichobilharzia szidati]|nr:unnamed protein product [Trichobilharzia szidati]
MDRYDFFLGGACNPTTWRKDVVIPILESLGLSYYNPQVDVWSPDLIKLEKNAKLSSDILLFVFENWKTRGLVSLLEVIYLASQRKPLVVTVSKVEDTGPLLIAGESIDKLEYYYLEEAMNYFLKTIKRLRIPCFSDVETAVNHAIRNSYLRFKSSGNLTHEEKKSIDKIQYVSHVLRGIIGTIPKSADSQFVYEQVRQGFQSLNIELTNDRDFVKYWNKVDRLDLLYSLYAEHVLNRKSPALLSNFNVYLTSKLLNNSETSESCLSNKRLVQSSAESNSLIDLMESQFDERLLYSFSQPDTSSHGDSRCASIKSSACSSSSLPPLQIPDLNNTRNTVDLKTDIYIAGISEENKHSQFLWDNNIMPKLAKVNLSHYRAIEKTVCPSIGNNEDFLNCYEDLESKQLEIRQNSKLLLYIIDNNSFHLVTMLEAVYSMGCHLPVVLFVQMFNSSSGCEIPLENSKPNSLHEFISNDFKTQQLPMNSLIDMKIKSSTTSSSSSSGASSDFTGTNSSLSEEELSQRSSSLEFGIIRDIYKSTKHSSNSNNLNCSNVKSSEILSFQANANVHMNNTHSSANIITVHNSSISLSQQAVNDYNRVRMYLIDLAEELNIPVFYDIEAAISFCIHKLTTL